MLRKLLMALLYGAVYGLVTGLVRSVQVGFDMSQILAATLIWGFAAFVMLALGVAMFKLDLDTMALYGGMILAVALTVAIASGNKIDDWTYHIWGLTGLAGYAAAFATTKRATQVTASR
jgi:hypothetical protein